MKSYRGGHSISNRFAIYWVRHCLICFALFVQLRDLVALVRGKLSRMQRGVLSALIVIEVHAKDVAAKLIEENVMSENDFEWISQLR